jgi:hypothetical protein
MVAMRDVHALAGGACRQGTLLELDMVLGFLEGALAAPMDGASVPLGQVLHERATEGNIQDLHPSADRQDRDLGGEGMADRADLEVVSVWIRGLGSRLPRVAVARRIQVGTTD